MKLKLHIILITVIAITFTLFLPIRIFSADLIDDFSTYDLGDRLGNDLSGPLGTWEVPSNPAVVSDLNPFIGEKHMRIMRNAEISPWPNKAYYILSQPHQNYDYYSAYIYFKDCHSVDDTVGVFSVILWQDLNSLYHTLKINRENGVCKIFYFDKELSEYVFLGNVVNEFWYRFVFNFKYEGENRFVRHSIDGGSNWSDWIETDLETVDEFRFSVVSHSYNDYKSFYIDYIEVGDDILEIKAPPPEPSSSINFDLFTLYDVEPRGYYEVPQNYEYNQKFKIQWKPETKVWWSGVSKARLNFVNLDNYASSSVIELPFDETFWSHEGVLGAGRRAYDELVELDNQVLSPGTYAVSISFFLQHLTDWSGYWNNYRLLGYFLLPNPDTGEYPEIHPGVPELPDDYFEDEPTWLINKFNEIKYNFPFGYYFVIKDVFDNVDYQSTDDFPAVVEASFPIAGQNINVPIFGLGVIDDEYPELFIIMKDLLTLFFWALFGFYIYERVIHKPTETGFKG